MTSTGRWFLIAVVLLLVAAACAPPAPAQPAKPEAPPAQPKQPVAKPDPEQLWEELAEAARTEGRVVIATFSPELRDQLGPAFRERFGVEAEILVARGPEHVARLETERAAGVYSMDVVITGITSMGEVMLPGGMLTPLKPLIVHPEALDPSMWPGGELLFADPEGQYILATAWRVSNLIVYNADFVDGAELQTTDDLLNPKFRGQMSTDDPATPGTGLQTALTFLHFKGEDYFRQLYVEQEPLITQDRRQLYDWLARGVPPITLSVVEEELVKLIEEGFNVETTWPADIPPSAGVGGGHIVALDSAPHPNAMKLFLNWLLTAEAQDIFARSLARTSMRTDVPPPDNVPDYLIPQPGVEYFNTDGWDFRIGEAPREAQQRIREIMGVR